MLSLLLLGNVFGSDVTTLPSSGSAPAAVAQKSPADQLTDAEEKRAAAQNSLDELMSMIQTGDKTFIKNLFEENEGFRKEINSTLKLYPEIVERDNIFRRLIGEYYGKGQIGSSSFYVPITRAYIDLWAADKKIAEVQKMIEDTQQVDRAVAAAPLPSGSAPAAVAQKSLDTEIDNAEAHYLSNQNWLNSALSHNIQDPAIRKSIEDLFEKSEFRDSVNRVLEKQLGPKDKIKDLVDLLEHASNAKPTNQRNYAFIMEAYTATLASEAKLNKLVNDRNLINGQRIAEATTR